ncbi:hypothetical protein AJ80_08618 [Polytolypa hystricis UAMH7299]|uniref:Flavin-containing monooxygenase 1 n=1 Tax=Polytolypa hystricis (strain UAMH7299) TaxID=1447883 RepID=A0A2B7X4D0_POLH7|nr:hypothetical protein AJ80_08618 [Polytolypa hystricis UAMH7299]
MPPINVAIIGAGLSGLTALKQCRSDGIPATIFEARDGIGGQWRYEEPDAETGHAMSSMYEGVILNSCRDTSTFSDFPIDPARYPDYFSHRRFLRYIEDYADNFKLRPYVRLNTKVLSCKPQEDGKWLVTRQENGKEEIEEVFDAVLACSGHVSRPLIPKFEGMETFKGQILHSHVYRRPGTFEGKRVAIIGFGSSAADISCEIGSQAKELHVITRRGGWVLPRYAFGKPIEAYDSRIAETVLPQWLTQWAQTKICETVVGKLPDVIKPAHGIFQANVTVRSDLVESIKTGRVTPHRAGVEKITEDSIVLTDGTMLEVDAIICCTGYHMDFPYLPQEIYHVKDNPTLDSPNSLDLYKLVVSPRFKNLFFIGFVELPGPIVPVSEVQARWATAIILKNVRLPSVKEMEESIKSYQEHIAKTMVRSDRHTINVRYLPYCDDLLQELGAAPTFKKLLLNFLTSNTLEAASLLLAVYFGINSPAQYRLFGYGKKTQLAKTTLLRLWRGGKELTTEERKLARPLPWPESRPS